MAEIFKNPISQISDKVTWFSKMGSLHQMKNKEKDKMKDFKFTPKTTNKTKVLNLSLTSVLLKLVSNYWKFKQEKKVTRLDC